MPKQYPLPAPDLPDDISEYKLTQIYVEDDLTTNAKTREEISWAIQFQEKGKVLFRSEFCFQGRFFKVYHWAAKEIIGGAYDLETHFRRMSFAFCLQIA